MAAALNNGDLGIFLKELSNDRLKLDVEDGIEDVHLLPKKRCPITHEKQIRAGESGVYIKRYDYGGFHAVNPGERDSRPDKKETSVQLQLQLQ